MARAYYFDQKSKFNNRKVKVNGEKIDSKKEARRWQELQLMERAGLITDLQRQVRFQIIPAKRDKAGKILKDSNGNKVGLACNYIADFVYWKDGEKIVEDVKGYREGAAYNLYVIKRKLMLHVYGIMVREI